MAGYYAITPFAGGINRSCESNQVIKKKITNVKNVVDFRYPLARPTSLRRHCHRQGLRWVEFRCRRFIDCGSGHWRSFYSKTGSGLGAIQSVDVAGCSGSSCNLKIGNSASMSLTFSSGVDTSKLTSKVAGVILGLEVPFNLPEPNSCLLGNQLEKTNSHQTWPCCVLNDLFWSPGAFCPIKYGDLNTIGISLPILPIYPAVSLRKFWRQNFAR